MKVTEAYATLKQFKSKLAKGKITMKTNWLNVCKSALSQHNA